MCYDTEQNICENFGHALKTGSLTSLKNQYKFKFSILVSGCANPVKNILQQLQLEVQ